MGKWGERWGSVRKRWGSGGKVGGVWERGKSVPHFDTPPHISRRPP